MPNATGERSVHFTKREIDALPFAAPGKRDYYRDARFAVSLRLAVTDKGVKSWVVQKRVQGRVARVTLGRYPDLTPENAKRKAEEISGQVSSGHDPRTVKRQARAKHLTLGEAFEAMIAVHRLKPKTIQVYRQVLGAALGDWLPKSLATITKDMVAERHARLSRENGGPYADSAMRTLRAVWNYTAGVHENERGESLLPPNPVDRLSRTKAWNRPKRRETYVREDQLPAWFAAVQNLREEPAGIPQTVGDYLMLLILTGLRRTEGASLLWEQVDLKARTLKVLDTKNGDDHSLPLSDYLFDLLSRRAEDRRDSRYVFPGETPTDFLKEPRYQLARVIDQSGVTFALHDLRRTFSTVAESLDLSHYALKRLLNHRMAGDVTAGYIGKNVERLREPMQRITDYFLEASSTSRPRKVVSILEGRGRGKPIE